MSQSLRCLILVLILSILTSASFAFDGDSCVELKNMVKRTLDETPETKSTDTQIADIVGDDTKIAFLGEVLHTDLDAIKHEAAIISALQKRGFNCLFIEIPDTVTAFSKLKATPQGMERAEKALKDVGYNTMVMKSGWLSAAHAAKQAGMKVFEFDLDQGNTDEFGEKLLHLRRRNSYMWNHLLKRLKNGTCKKAITLNGYYHLVIDSMTKTRSLEGMAVESGLSYKTILLRSRSLEQGNPMLGQTCDYEKLGGSRSYVLNERSEITDFFRHDMDYISDRNEEEIPPVMLDGNRSIVVY